MVPNAITIDVEDWYHVCGTDNTTSPPPETAWRVHAATERILVLLGEYGIKATFFVLGRLAEALPGMVERIASGGHEIASHGWSHSLLHDLSEDEFHTELERTEQVLTALTGTRPAGFRAPQWSVSDRTPWVHPVLVERGYCYDSSMAPLALIGNHRGPRVPFTVVTPSGNIRELPPLTSVTPFGNLPTGGGWGFRFFPMLMIEKSITDLNAAQQPAVLYLHPRDADPDGPRLSLPPLKRFAAYGSRTDALPRLRGLLEQFSFTTMKELAG